MIYIRENCFAGIKLDRMSAYAVHTLFNFFGNVSERYGRHFLWSRQCLHFAAFEPRAILICTDDFVGIPRGGFIGLIEDEDQEEGKWHHAN